MTSLCPLSCGPASYLPYHLAIVTCFLLLATRHVPLPTPHSPLATCHSPLATRYSLRRCGVCTFNCTDTDESCVAWAQVRLPFTRPHPHPSLNPEPDPDPDPDPHEPTQSQRAFALSVCDERLRRASALSVCAGLR